MQRSISQCMGIQKKWCPIGNHLGHKYGYGQWPGMQSCRETEDADVTRGLECVDSFQEACGSRRAMECKPGEGTQSGYSPRVYGVQVEITAGKSSTGQAGAVKVIRKHTF